MADPIAEPRRKAQEVQLGMDAAALLKKVSEGRERSIERMEIPSNAGGREENSFLYFERVKGSMTIRIRTFHSNTDLAINGALGILFNLNETDIKARRDTITEYKKDYAHTVYEREEQLIAETYESQEHNEAEYIYRFDDPAQAIAYWVRIKAALARYQPILR